LKESDNGKKKISKFKEEGLMNTSLNEKDYVTLLKKWDESREKVFGMESQEYQKILKFCQMDQIDYTQPDLTQAVQDMSLINKERKNIRKNYKKSYCNLSQDNEGKFQNSPIKLEKGKKLVFKNGRIFEKKKVVIKNPGFILKGDNQEVVVCTPETQETKQKLNIIPLIVKSFRKFRELKK